jgi:putative membrane protein
MTLLKTMIIAGTTACIAASVAPGALAQTTTSPPATKQQTNPQQAATVASDSDFVQKATVGNRFEVEAGQLAATKATDAKLKDFARMMVTDHGAALKKLEDAARAAGAPPVKAGLDAAHQSKLDALKAKSGAEFDRQYKADMKQAHEDTLAMLTSYKQNGKNDKLRAWAEAALPTVQKHRDTINAM